MRKIGLEVLATLCLLVVSGIAIAQAQTQANGLPEPGMLPDSPFYFLKSWTEVVGTFFTFGDVAKAERFVNLSEKRLAEAQALVEKGKPEIAEKAISRYQNQLDKALTKAEEAKTKGLDTDEVLAKVAEATLKHQEVLAEVYEKVPEQAKEAIEHAIEASIRGREEALKAVSGQKREEVMEQIEQRKQEVEQKLEGLIPGRQGAQEQEVETPETPEIPEVEQETPGGGRPETPGRP